MADLNRVFLMGRLTADPELRKTQTGLAVTELRLATSRNWTSKAGERKEDTLYVDISVWDRQAETCCQYLKKGSSIHVEGSLKMDTWEDKNTGDKRSKIKILADRVQFLDRRPDSPAGDTAARSDSYASRDQANGSQTPRYPQANRASGRHQQPASRPSVQPVPDDHQADVDIPF